ncbi:MAG: 4-hydroxy-tetrahydrodipicolinate reductase [Chloroflexi bacterium]|nr:4-hydroxy-tetrahydrodipicolinate reductase [Chloroflexota bacterium]|tara:strand:+ start:2220 stop:3011 length:792 start_codon:yes stop_codon:yes gene_type:complete
MTQRNHLISVAVHGSAGKVGQEVVRALDSTDNMSLVASIDQVDPFWLPVGVEHFKNFDSAIDARKFEVLVDFTNSEATMNIMKSAISAGVRLVIGSTGFTNAQISELHDEVSRHDTAAILAPNFTIGAVLLGKLAKIAAPFFDFVEVSEEHHENKIDAPSGTAISIVQSIKEGHPDKFMRNEPSKEPIGNTRGGSDNGISIHSSRLPGKLAHHQVTFGNTGQTLTLRHDTINRECYMPGVLLAVNEIVQRNGLIIGLESLLDI